MKIIPLVQGSDDWRRWRAQGLGGSDVATILGLLPFEDCTPELLLREKCEPGYVKPDNFAMRRGNRLEPVARALYEQSRQCYAPPQCVEHSELSWARVSLDGLCIPHAEDVDVDPWILELKCANQKVHDLALEGLVVDYYQPQCQWQLFVTGLDLLHFANYTEAERFAESDRLAVVTVEPDADYQRGLLSAVKPFWARVLERREELARQTRDRNDRLTQEVI
jgi:putative phage-type endonuclease